MPARDFASIRVHRPISRRLEALTHLKPFENSFNLLTFSRILFAPPNTTAPIVQVDVPRANLELAGEKTIGQSSQRLSPK